MSDSVRPHRWQPTRLLHPWDSPGKSTGVGCHFLLHDKDIEEIKKSESITNNAITEIKSTLEGTNSRITEAEDRISEVEDRIVETN